MRLDTATLLEEQVALLEAGDAAALARRYHPDGVVLHVAGTAQGDSAIRALFDQTLAASPPRVRSATVLARTEDTVLYDVVEDLAGTTVRIVGAIVLRDGLIWRHTSVPVPLDG